MVIGHEPLWPVVLVAGAAAVFLIRAGEIPVFKGSLVAERHGTVIDALTAAESVVLAICGIAGIMSAVVGDEPIG
jgi:hypothetical protein